MRVAVVVLGDLARSPRMLNHAVSLAREGHVVDLVGFVETGLPSRVTADPEIRVWPLPSARPRRGSPSALGRPTGGTPAMAARAARLAGSLAATLLRRVPRPDLILVQSPPSVPTVPVALAAARLRGAGLVVDWHNLGWTILALRLGPGHPLVGLLQRWETGVGRRAGAHLCVSRCMAGRLRELGVGESTVVRDRPAVGLRGPPSAEADWTGRPRVVCPMGWTLDDDVGLLLEALGRYDAAARGDLPSLEVVLSGTGPLRSEWEPRIAGLALKRVRLRTEFVPADDYPRLLGSARVGISVHRSSSGVDLPMKIVDMYGAGLPVLALDYGPCLEELVRDGEDSLLFRTAEELAAHLVGLFRGHPERTPLLDHLVRGVRSRAGETWHEGWRNEALPVLEAAAR